ncbi:unnamed protein product [Menidia menidia]|uniref:Protection of telomeres protein 1 n=1 Tax=Menidia menidia TaxID=238744 RepID=A0A8S4B9R2_9TELE|nr:unnamed protein product [Menidia menidia]
MPIHVLSEGKGPSAPVPAHLTRIPVALLTTSTECADKVVKGKVVRKGPLVAIAPDDFILKTIIHDEESMLDVSAQNSSINVIWFGDLAKNFSQDVNEGDVVELCGFRLGKSPTAKKDKLHPCNLLLSGNDAHGYVTRVTKAPKYKYVRLNDLKDGSIVNVYGVVVFFKQPFKSRGTDFCSSLRITDQSNHKISCTVFCEKLEDHPKIFRIGDIIRMHRVKAQFFNNAMTLVNTFGFSAVTFDGAVDAAVNPQTSSHRFHFDQEDQQRVRELRSWAASQDLLLSPSDLHPLSAVQPKDFFDLTCQLLAKAPIDINCTLLRVWDGTVCSQTLLKVIVEPNLIEGPSSFPEEKERLIANVFVYDNHVGFAKELKPGDFLRIYNLQALPGLHKLPGLTSRKEEEMNHLAFHLHGGTSYGRGIKVLPEDNPEVQSLKKVIQSVEEDVNDKLHNLDDLELLEVWSTPPESLERSCGPHMEQVTLSQLKHSRLEGVHHVRAQLVSFEPRRLSQALKLFCSKCASIEDVPDEDQVAAVFSESCRHSEVCSPPPWALSGYIDIPADSPGSRDRALSVYLSTELLIRGKTKDLVFLMGTSLEETCKVAEGYRNLVPVTAAAGHLSLLSQPAPFLFRGGNRYYGCKRCSKATIKEPNTEGEQVMDEKMVAEALDVQLLQNVLLMKFKLQDSTDTLDVFLWQQAETFFGVSAEEIAANQDVQSSICQTLNSLCPEDGGAGGRPWLNLCLMAYRPECDGFQSQTCYQLCNSSLTLGPLQHPPPGAPPTAS